MYTQQQTIGVLFCVKIAKPNISLKQLAGTTQVAYCAAVTGSAVWGMEVRVTGNSWMLGICMPHRPDATRTQFA